MNSIMHHELDYCIACLKDNQYMNSDQNMKDIWIGNFILFVSLGCAHIGAGHLSSFHENKANIFQIRVIFEKYIKSEFI